MPNVRIKAKELKQLIAESRETFTQVNPETGHPFGYGFKNVDEYVLHQFEQKYGHTVSANMKGTDFELRVMKENNGNFNTASVIVEDCGRHTTSCRFGMSVADKVIERSNLVKEHYAKSTTASGAPAMQKGPDAIPVFLKSMDYTNALAKASSARHVLEYLLK